MLKIEKEKVRIICDIDKIATFIYDDSDNNLTLNYYDLDGNKIMKIFIDPFKNKEFLEVVGKDSIRNMISAIGNLNNANDISECDFIFNHGNNIVVSYLFKCMGIYENDKRLAIIGKASIKDDLNK